MQYKNTQYLILLLWAFLVIVSLACRSYIPIDETRYVTVAWNMWLSGDYLVPFLNGIAYSDKPPLLFWLINLGWATFGINDWWPRLIPSLFALASVFITRKIAALLWPNKPEIKDTAALILFSCGLWVAFSTALMFDMLIAFFSVLGIWGLLIAHKNDQLKGWLLFAVAIGGGLLAKGPTIFVQLIPVALLIRFWDKNDNQKVSVKNWYLPVLYTLSGGIAIGLLWAVPAGIRGGDEYQHAIFLGQTTGRVINAFAHNRPIWWYIPLLPLLLFPWLFFGTVWRGVSKCKSILNEFGLRFCIAWLLSVFLIFSLISGKQVHYILPIFPALSLLFARFISHSELVKTRDFAAISIASFAIGTVLLALPYYAKTHSNVASWIQLIPYWPEVLMLISAIAVYFIPKKSTLIIVSWLSTYSVIVTTVFMFSIIRTAGEAYDVRPISKHVKMLESKQIPVAYLGRYEGMYNFLGRLQHSPESVSSLNISAWFDSHPNGRVIAPFDDVSLVNKSSVEFVQAYKSKAVAVLTRSQFLALNKSDKQN